MKQEMMKLSELLSVLNVRQIEAQLIGEDIGFDCVGIDSRQIKRDQLFIAIKGENFDGNAFAVESLQLGAAAAIISDNTVASQIKHGLLVKDTRIALGLLGEYWRQKFAIPVIAITGSNGKTTVKEMVASILRTASGSAEAVLATRGNLNNDFGMPLTLLQMNKHHQYAVIEMGMNHTGEIAYLTKLAHPTVALVNNAGTAHIGELGSKDAIAAAKGEIFSGLENAGIAIVNADDSYASYWIELIKQLGTYKKITTFGLNGSGAKSVDVTALVLEQADITQLNLTTPKGGVSFELTVLGQHNVSNALAASAVAVALNISLQHIATGLANFTGVAGRLTQRIGFNEALIIDDTYNANPDSMRAAIDVLTAKSGKTIFVMGDMGELGNDAAELHAEIGQYAQDAGVQVMYAIGENSAEATRTFDSTNKKQQAYHFETVEDLVAALKLAMDKLTTVLVKGSRFMRMERVVNLIIKKPEIEQQEQANQPEKMEQGAH